MSGARSCRAMGRWAEKFIAVDWGTTNRRAYLIERGQCVREHEDALGILSVEVGKYHAAVDEIRQMMGREPMLLAGMIGSNRGWKEAPYLRCPAGLQDLSAGLTWAGDDAAIVPGLALSEGRCDVMRGEEIQILGAVESGQIPTECSVCHPGTHNKWIRVEGGRITSFRTVMTGELFNLLKDRSILSDLLQGEASVGDAFRDGVRKALEGTGVTTLLFEARARYLLGKLERGDAASFVSGLLIGEDVRAGYEVGTEGPVIVMGRPDLTELYAAALAERGLECERVDGEGAFLAGAARIAETLE